MKLSTVLFPFYHLTVSSSVAANSSMTSTILPVNMLKRNEFVEPLTASSRVFPVKDVRLTKSLRTPFFDLLPT